jgi:2-dehydropantoate 2-reductase
VSFIARGAHLEAIREGGLQVYSANGDFRVYPACASDDPAEVGLVDYVVVAVKHYHLGETVPLLKPLVGPETTVLPLLNGVDAHEALVDALGPEPVLGGLCSIVSMVESPGVIRQPSKIRRVIVGELDRTRSVRVERIVQAWVDCGADAIHPEDIFVAMWTKFVFIASFGGVSSLAGATIGEVIDCEPTRNLYIEAIREAETMARAQDIALDSNILEKTIALTESFKPDTTSSMQRDVAAGNRFELEAFSGTIVRLGEQLGIPTPVHRAIYALLKPALLRAISL